MACVGGCTFGSDGVSGAPDSVGQAEDASTGDFDPTTGGLGGDGLDVDPEDGTSSGPDTDDDDDTSGDDDDDDDLPSFEACPDPMPEGWIFCEDFEGIESVPDLESVFAVVDTAGGRLAPTDVAGHSGSRSLRVAYDGINQWNGRVGILFGGLPFDWTGPAYASDTHADEIWVRFHTRSDDDWPGIPPGQSMRIATLRGTNWTPPAQLNLITVGGNLSPTAQAMGCMGCSGFDDWGNYPQLTVATASKPVYDDASATQWHCVELRLQLNTPGQADAQIDVSIDGELDAFADDFDWRGSSEEGWNYVALHHWWSNPGTLVEVDRYYDDLIVSTAPIGGCGPS